ncbi:hypothetical protein AGMMS50267_02800 [Spirochaetia bacterium]|nr:hypothetical protein AGMMS50267_02800 [Spirochaetia bacterium]
MKMTILSICLFLLFMTLPVLRMAAQTQTESATETGTTTETATEPGATTEPQATTEPETSSGAGVTTTTILVPSAGTNAKDQKPEFPLWARDLRRADIILFGSFPFMFFTATFAIDTYRWQQHWDDRRYAPWPIKSPGAVSLTIDEYKIALSAAAGGAVLAALADYLIIRVKRAKAAREAAKLPPGVLVITRTPQSAGEAEDPLPEQDDGSGDGSAVPPAAGKAGGGNTGAP